MQLPETESPVQNISTHRSLEPIAPRIATVGAGLVGSTFRRIVGVTPREYRRNYGLIL
jgi:hypothetical protein